MVVPTYETTAKDQELIISRLKKENQELKKQLEIGKEQYDDLVEEKENLQEQLSNSHQIKNQQKEFIEWLKEKSYQTHFQLQTALIYEEVLSKYKEIIGEHE